MNVYHKSAVPKTPIKIVYSTLVDWRKRRNAMRKENKTYLRMKYISRLLQKTYCTNNDSYNLTFTDG